MKDYELEIIKSHLELLASQIESSPMTDAGEVCRKIRFISGCITSAEKPRTKTELKPADYSSVSGAIAAHESGVKFVRLLPDGSTEDLSWFALCDCYAKGYKIRVVKEVEIDERQEFIEVACERSGLSKHSVEAQVFGVIFDSGEFKLVEK